VSALSDLLLGTPPYIVQLQLAEFDHPAFGGSPYRVIRNSGRNGLEVTHEGPAGPFIYTYFPMDIKMAGSGNDLDQTIEVTVGDLGEILPFTLELISAANSWSQKPTLKYREYRSDDLSAPVYGPLEFRIDVIAFNHTGCVMKGKATSFNQGRVGVYYTDELFPMLKNVT
jgi:hypothetical protein